MALYKKDAFIGLAFAVAIIALMLTIFAQSHDGEQKDGWGTCVNQVAREAYVEDDVGDTFDAGFDAGLLAGELCK